MVTQLQWRRQNVMLALNSVTTGPCSFSSSSSSLKATTVQFIFLIVYCYAPGSQPTGVVLSNSIESDFKMIVPLESFHITAWELVIHCGFYWHIRYQFVSLWLLECNTYLFKDIWRISWDWWRFFFLFGAKNMMVGVLDYFLNSFSWLLSESVIL